MSQVTGVEGAMDGFVSEELAELADTGFEAPPIVVEGDDRRMQVRAYNYWASLLQGRALPSVADLDAGRLGGFGPHSLLLDLSRDPTQPVLRFVGGKLREESGLVGAEPGVADVPGRSLISRLTDHVLEVVANRAPIGFEAEFTSVRGLDTLYRGILMPMSTDGVRIDYVFGVINWRERIDAATGAALVADLARLGTVAPISPAHDPLTAKSVFDAPAKPGLAGRLGAAREAAEAAANADNRSRTALYRALSKAYDVHIAAQADADGYAAALEEAGIVAQARAPMTAVAKLVFGAAYDKARLTEFAAALAAAARAGVAEGGFGAFVVAEPGGLKALVHAERGERRGGDALPAVEVARERLRSVEAVAHVPLTADGDAEFVLLVARRGASGLDVVAAVPHADALVDGALKRLR